MRMGGFCRRVRRRRCWGWCGEGRGVAGLGFCACVGFLRWRSEGWRVWLLEWGFGFGHGYGYGGLDTVKIRYGCGIDGPAIPVYGLVSLYRLGISNKAFGFSVPGCMEAMTGLVNVMKWAPDFAYLAYPLFQDMVASIIPKQNRTSP